MNQPQSETAGARNADLEIVTHDKAPLAVRMELSKVEAAIAHYPDEVRLDVIWLHNFRHTEFSGRTALLAHFLNKRLKIKASEQYVYQLLAGKYFRREKGTGRMLGSVDTVKEIAEACRQWAAVNADSCGLPFVEDEEWRDFCDYVDSVRNVENVIRFGGIVGPTGRGKTRMTQRYAVLNNHGSCVRIEASDTMTVNQFEQKLGWCYGVAFSAQTAERRERIYVNVRRDRTIFIENFQKLYRPEMKGKQKLLSAVQELQDETQCTIVATWTPGFTRIMEDDTTEEGKYLEQFVGRFGGLDRVHLLADHRPLESLRAIVARYEILGGKDSLAILQRWSRSPGRDRILFGRIQRAMHAAKLAKSTHVKLEHLQAVDVVDAPLPREEAAA